MSADIRLAVGFWQHPKVRKLEKRLGLKGVRSLQILWCWCALNRPSGTLAGMDAEDVELAADWRGKTGAFFEQCLGVWIDEIDGVYQLHEWESICPTQPEPVGRIWDVSRSEWKAIRQEVFKRDNYTCQYCGAKIDNPDCDHLVPFSRGGRSILENLVTACPSCNRSKGAKSLEEWLNGLV